MNPLRRTPIDWIVLALTLLCLIAAFVPLFYYNRIGADEAIPTHYNIKGEIDGWSNRSFFWITPLIALAMCVGLTVLERFYTKFNFPVRVTEANEESLYRLGVQLLRWLNLIVAGIFAYINLSTLSIALGHSNGMNVFILIPLIAGMLIIVLHFMIKMARYK